MTGPCRPTHSGCSRASEGEPAVTPVIGAVIILLITVLGIGGVLVWGAPMIDRIQASNAQTAIVGEFEDLRIASRELSVPDHSRFPTVVLPRGELGIERGSRFLVTANFEGGVCDYRVTGWASGAATATGCSGTTNSVYLVAGDTLVPQASYSNADPGTDWLWRNTGAACPLVGSINLCAEAWLLSGDRIKWSLTASDSTRTVTLDNGAIFSEEAGTQFLQKEPIIADTVFGNTGSAPYYGLWLRSLDASSYASITGSGSHQVYFSLIGNYLRTDADVYRIRIDVSGTLSEGWCNALLVRNDRLPDGSDAGTEPDSSYHTSDAANACVDIDSSSSAEVRSVCYALVVSTSNACTSAPTPFTFRLLHARIYSSLAI